MYVLLLIPKCLFMYKSLDEIYMLGASWYTADVFQRYQTKIFVERCLNVVSTGSSSYQLMARPGTQRSALTSVNLGFHAFNICSACENWVVYFIQLLAGGET